MSADTTTRKVAFSSTAVADYPFTFRALTSAPSDIKVKVTASGTTSALTYTTDYTVAVNSNGVGGTVTLVTTYGTATHIITIYRETTNLQESDYNDYNQFPSNTLETDLDRRTMLAQEMAEDITRCAKLDVSSTITTLALPAPSTGKCWVWTGNTLRNSTYDIDTQQAAAASESTTAVAAAVTAVAAEASAQSYATNALTYSTSVDISKVGTPVNDQVGVWTGDGTLEGRATMVITTEGVLTLSGNSGARAYLNGGSIAISSATTTIVLLDTESYDTQSEMDIASNKGRFTAKVTGYYDVIAQAVWFDNTVAKAYRTSIYKNNAEIATSYTVCQSTSSINVSVACSDVVYLLTNDYIEMAIYTTANSGERVWANKSTYLSVNKIR